MSGRIDQIGYATYSDGMPEERPADRLRDRLGQLETRAIYLKDAISAVHMDVVIQFQEMTEQQREETEAFILSLYQEEYRENQWEQEEIRNKLERMGAAV